MKIYFDNCTELLIKDIKSVEKKESKAFKLYELLPQLKKVYISNELCPKGEFERSYLCRQFLREIVRNLEKEINGAFSPDPLICSLLKTTKDYIESSKKETEHNRAIVVLRNVMILKYNADLQKENNGLPLVGGKKELKLKACRYNDESVKYLYKALGISPVKADDLLKKPDEKNAFNSLGYNDYLLKGYKQMFVYSAVKSLESMEV